MTGSPTRLYPQLPPLSLAQCLHVFQSVDVPPTVVAKLSGFTRMQVYRWYRGKSSRPHAVTVDYLNHLAYKLLRAQKDGRLFERRCFSVRRWADAINDSTYPTPLARATVDDVITQEWAVALNLPVGEENGDV